MGDGVALSGVGAAAAATAAPVGKGHMECQHKDERTSTF